MDVRCKVAVVTGGACGIGFSIASELLCQEAYRVIIADNNIKRGTEAKEALEIAHGKNRVCFYPVDVNKGNNFLDVFKMAHETLGGVDILVNNAGTLKDRKWELSIDTNLASVMRGTLLGFEWMQKEKKSMAGGIIVNIASVSGLDVDETSPVLTAAKHGVVGLTKAFGGAVHFHRTGGVRVVGICPGKTKASEPEEDKNMSPEFKLAYFDPKVPGQMPRKVAKAVNYVIRYAPSGTIWVVENSQLYKAKFPKSTVEKYSEVIDVV